MTTNFDAKDLRAAARVLDMLAKRFDKEGWYKGYNVKLFLHEAAVDYRKLADGLEPSNDDLRSQ